MVKYNFNPLNNSIIDAIQTFQTLLYLINIIDINIKINNLCQVYIEINSDVRIDCVSSVFL